MGEGIPPMIPLRIFIGYDSKETVAYHVLCHSILARATRPVALIPIALNHLSGHYTRKRGPTESTEFSMTRFLVPYLSGYEGVSIFMDCDMLCLADIWEVLSMVDADAAVNVCKHDYTPKTKTKMEGLKQTAYPRKNWSSFIVFNNEKCRALTPEYVNTASGLDLHRFKWLPDEAIGSLPLEWNWLCGEYHKPQAARILHYTLGGPWMECYASCDNNEEWFAEHEAMNSPSKVGAYGA
jgi:hypothetical protein